MLTSHIFHLLKIENIFIYLTICMIAFRGVTQIITDIFLWIMFAIYIFSVNKKIWKKEIIILLMIFFCLIFISGLASSTLYESFKYLVYFLYFIVFFVIFNKKNIPTVIQALVIINIFFAILVAVDLITTQKIYQIYYLREAYIRLMMFMGNPNYYGYFSLISFILIFIFYPEKKIKTFLLIAIYVMTLLTVSRGVIIALTIFVAYNIVTKFLNKKIYLNAFYLFLLLILLLIAGNQLDLINLDLINLERFISTVEYRLDDLNSASGRYEIWQIGFEGFSSSLKNIFIGVGPNLFVNLSPDELENTAHNSFIRITFEIGIIAAIVVFYLIYRMVYLSKSISKKDKVIILLSISIAFVSNDFILNKETWLLMAILLNARPLSKHTKGKT